MYTNEGTVKSQQTHSASKQNEPKFKFSTTLSGIDSRLILFRSWRTKYVFHFYEVDVANRVFMGDHYFHSSVFYDEYGPSFAIILVWHLHISEHLVRANMMSSEMLSDTKRVLSKQLMHYLKHFCENYCWVANDDCKICVNDLIQDYFEFLKQTKPHVYHEYKTVALNYTSYIKICFTDILIKENNVLYIKQLSVNIYIIVI